MIPEEKKVYRLKYNAPQNQVGGSYTGFGEFTGHAEPDDNENLLYQFLLLDEKGGYGLFDENDIVSLAPDFDWFAYRNKMRNI